MRAELTTQTTIIPPLMLKKNQAQVLASFFLAFWVVWALRPETESIQQKLFISTINLTKAAFLFSTPLNGRQTPFFKSHSYTMERDLQLTAGLVRRPHTGSSHWVAPAGILYFIFPNHSPPTSPIPLRI
jgi:hypothetical protein